MHEIVVLSGKGGTGKTSISAALAVLAGVDAIIADCDVDAANMHLLLKPDFGQIYDFFSGEIAEINPGSCIQCNICADVCRFQAIPFQNGLYKINSLNCEGCGYCEKVCPTHAITMHERLSGKVFISKTRAGNTMVHAKLDIGAENSGKLVAKVKNEAKRIALNESKSVIIVDGAPGIGCPVISALSGANYVILVTEPTMSGLHDLRRAYDVINQFRIKTGCIINKFDLNPQKTTEIIHFLNEMNISHLADIPYDISFTQAMIEEKTIVETESSLKSQIENVWKKINEEIINNNSIK